MMIEDEELRAIFQAESADGLLKLEEGLLALERAPRDTEQLEKVFRVAHSLKGAASMLGVSAVETLAHQFEDVLDRARRGQQELTSGMADRLYGALDAMSGLVEEAVSGKPSGVDLKALLEQMRSPLPPKAAPKPPPPPVAEEPSPGPSTVEEASAGASIRVDTARLDRALETVGDLVVTTARAGLRRAELESLRELHHNWVREWRLETRTADQKRWQREGLRLAQMGERLEAFARNLEDDHARLASVTDVLRDEIQEMRLRPMTGLLHRFRRMVRDLAVQEGKSMTLVVEGAETTADRRLLEGLKDPLMHLIRNAVDHGVESPARRAAAGKSPEATLSIRASRVGTMLHLELSDDGAGLDLNAIRRKALEHRLRTEEQLAAATPTELAHLIFAAGFSTRSVVSDLSGRGTGLDAVRASVEALSGSVDVESQPGQGCTFRLRLPLTLATTQVMVCRDLGQLYAIPLTAVDCSIQVDASRVLPVEGRVNLELQGAPVPLASLARILGGPNDAEAVACVVLREGEERSGFTTSELLGVMELVVKPLGESRLVQGASILADGAICLVLHPTELLRRSRSSSTAPSWTSAAESTALRVLLVEDSPTMRATESKVLTGAGYRVTSACDGQEGWEHLQNQHFDAVISDIEMPRLNGLELTRRLRTLARYNHVPVILVTTLSSDADRQAGLEAGASAYLSKTSFEAGLLLRTLERLL